MAFHDNYLTYKDINYEIVSLRGKLVLCHNWMLHYSLCQWIQLILLTTSDGLQLQKPQAEYPL